MSSISKRMFAFYLICVYCNEAMSQYHVSLTTGGIAKESTIRQYYLSDYDAFPSNDRFIRFQLKGSGGTVYLESTDKTDTDKKIFYCLFIGAWSNTKSAILYVNDTFSSSNQYTKHIVAEKYGSHLSTTSFKQLWLSWCGEEIKLGFGSRHNEDVVVSWRNPSPFDVVDIAVASAYTCYWGFQSNTMSQYDLSVTTGGVGKESLIRQRYLTDDNAFPTQDCYVEFLLKGNGAAVYLESTDKSNTDKRAFYYIFIGAWNNEKSAILYVNDTFSSANDYADHIVAETYGTHISATSYKHYWLSWCGKEIKLGFGTEYNENAIVSWRDPCLFKVVDMAMASAYDCYWTFKSNLISLANGTAECPENKMCNNVGRGCPPTTQYSLYTHLSTCLEYQTIQSMNGLKHACMSACSQDVNCRAVTLSEVDDTCRLLSGNIIQSYNKTDCYLKRQLQGE